MWKDSMVLTIDSGIFGSCSFSILDKHPFEETSSILQDCEKILLWLEWCQGLTELMDPEEQEHVHLNIRKTFLFFFYCKNNHSLELPPQEHD